MVHESSGLTLSDAMAQLVGNGFDADFGVVHDRDRPTIRCGRCRGEVAAAQATVLALHRIEGESDPADEAVVAGIRCEHCGACGVLVATYGPMADPADADVVTALTDAREQPKS
jgi:hypothetical protein